ncbi:phosphoribosylaminoimidazolesuccinocarboxamide synthase [Candidatus Uhrbacteria bacterium]|nr:phosphoribosylaminoimidazolesuccinocarboxamide synthase [Candidatus Uhrbacteria bacterium]
MEHTPLSFEQIHLQQFGLVLMRHGKVRDTYHLPGHPHVLLQVASDRISIFDFVLPATVPGKGALLTALTVFWLRDMLGNICEHHLVAYGTEIDHYLPRELQSDNDLQTRALVVTKLRMLPIECIVRGYLTGSGWKSYQETGEICGHKLPPGLHDGSKLREPIFTPTTKAQEGHDEGLSRDRVVADFGPWVERFSLKLYDEACGWAEKRGIIIADTKFEFGLSRVVGDEVLTPDSSRFWLVPDWQQACAQGKSPQGYDKQFFREWGKTVETPFASRESKRIMGIHRLDPKDENHRKFVQGLAVPASVIEKTGELYQQIFRRLTGVGSTMFHAIEGTVLGEVPDSRRLQ